MDDEPMDTNKQRFEARNKDAERQVNDKASTSTV